jgi:hypothetical protein
MSDNDQQYEYASDTDGEEQVNGQQQQEEPRNQRTMQHARQNRQQNQALPPRPGDVGPQV